MSCSRSLYVVAVRQSVTFVHSTQATEIFRNNVTTPFGTLTSTENFTDIVPENPSVEGVKRKKGSRM